VADDQPPRTATTNEHNYDIEIQTDSNIISTAKSDEESISLKAHRAEESVLDVIDAVGAKVGTFTKEKLEELDKFLSPSYLAAIQDSHKISALGPQVDDLSRVFEETMTMVGNVSYGEQVDLLTGYKKLIEEQIKVIDSRINMAKRLK